jgi:nitrite reductase/ring-hydroxylating ferredoxin subunit
MGFVRVAEAGAIPPGHIFEANVDGISIAIANLDGKLFAISNICLHRGGPIGQGPLEGKIVTCPWHGWAFDVTTGALIHSPDAGLACYSVEVRGEEVFVDVGSPSASR